jgi:putative PIN family toxin of toxin-antitoxin system
VSYATHAGGARSRAIERAIRHRVRLITSEYILTEVERVLCEKLGMSRRLARLALASLRRKCSVVSLPLPAAEFVAADPDDDRIVQTALTGKADCVVTADKASETCESPGRRDHLSGRMVVSRSARRVTQAC